MPESTINTRIKEIADHYGLSTNKFAKTLGYARSENMRNVIAGNFAPKADILERIAKYFGEINCHWLLTGTGTMLLSDQKEEKNPTLVVADDYTKRPPELANYGDIPLAIAKALWGVEDRATFYTNTKVDPLQRDVDMLMGEQGKQKQN